MKEKLQRYTTLNIIGVGMLFVFVCGVFAYTLLTLLPFIHINYAPQFELGSFILGGVLGTIGVLIARKHNER